MKKIGKLLALLLTAATLLSLLPLSALAAGAPTFRVYCELDKSSYSVGDTVTAKVYLQRTDTSEDYALYNFTDHVVFNTDFLTYTGGENGPNDFIVDAGAGGNGTYWNSECNYISIRYQYISSGTPPTRSAAVLAATLRFKVTADCQTALWHDYVQVWTTMKGSGGETAVGEDAAITAGTPKYCFATFSGGAGASGSVSGMSKIPSGTYITLPKNGFTKSGKTFGGWYDGKAIRSAGSSYYLTADTAFTAVWKPAVITYSGGSGGDVLCVNPKNVRVLSGGNAEVGTVLTFTAAAAKGYQFAGWSDGSSENPRSVTVIGDVNITARFSSASGGASVPVVVDGTSYDIGKSSVTGDTTAVTVDQTALQKQLDTAKSSVVIPVAADTQKVEAQLVVKNVEDMAAKNMTLSVQVSNVSYEMPATAVDTSALMKSLNASDPAAVPVSVAIDRMDASSVTVSDGTLMVEPVSFTVTADYGGKSYVVENFTKYVARVIAIPDGVDAARITTAVVVENGTERHVPTNVYYENGKWYARINSLTDSVYALIYNQASFKDASGKWYESVVTEMASREIIDGVGGGRFEGGRSITRAEFAAIVVRALGLPANGGSGTFKDVAAGKWYYGAVSKAYEYGIVSGRGSGIFDPQANITRQEAMVMVTRAAKIAEYSGAQSADLSGFGDSSAVENWARASVEYNVANGFIVGSNGMLRPGDNITRGETATVMLRLLQKSGLIDIRTK
jgi:hypothetical protein